MDSEDLHLPHHPVAVDQRRALTFRHSDQRDAEEGADGKAPTTLQGRERLVSRKGLTPFL